MKRIILYCILLAAACMIPVNRMDISNLEPIQAVKMSLQEGNILLQTDTGDVGIGKNVNEALSNMKQASEGIVYLDTAQFLTVSKDAQEYIGHMKEFLKGKVKVCIWDQNGNLEDVAKYMRAHKFGVSLKEWKREMNLPTMPVLTSDENR